MTASIAHIRKVQGRDDGVDFPISRPDTVTL
jgi:hypothetical protein